MSKGLIVDDDSFKGIGKYCLQQGKSLEKSLSEYVRIMKSVQQAGITKGKTAEALQAYISYVEFLQKKVYEASSDVNKAVNTFLTDINNIDKISL